MVYKNIRSKIFNDELNIGYYKKVPPKEIVYNNNNYEEINRERYQIPQRMNENRPKVEEIGPSTVPTPNMNFQQSMEPNHYTQTIEQKNSHNLPSMHTVIEKTKENSFENQRYENNQMYYILSKEVFFVIIN